MFYKKEKPWFAHPFCYPSLKEQMAWRRAVVEVNSLLEENELPLCCGELQHLPDENIFSCQECGEPTNELLCILCKD